MQAACLPPQIYGVYSAVDGNFQGKNTSPPLSFQNTSSARSDQVPDFQGAGRTAFDLPRSVDGGKHAVLTMSRL